MSDAPGAGIPLEMNFLTYQEHVLAGIEICKGYYEGNPHKPVGVIDGVLKVHEAAGLRQQQGRFAAQGKYFDMPGTVQVKLEDITIEGYTKRDPRVLNDRNEPMNTTYVKDFPYRRFETAAKVQ